MTNTSISRSNTMGLNQILTCLRQQDTIAGIALFGSLNFDHPASDYDLLLLVANPPVRIFQMQTLIDKRLADVTFVETEVADQVLALDQPVSATSSEGFLIGWLERAQIVYDRHGQFAQLQQKLKACDWRLPSSSSELYADSFWLNFDLRHIKRMALSDDLIYHTVAEVHLMTNLAHLWRVYYHVRGFHWSGATHAVRYLQQHDADYLALYRQCMSETNLLRRIAQFEQLVEITLSPVGRVWLPDTTAVYLKNPTEQPERVNEALAFWERLIST